MTSVQTVTLASPLVRYNYEKAVASYKAKQATESKLHQLASEVAQLGL